MKLLQIHFGKDGGAERFFVNLAGGLAEQGVSQRFAIRPKRAWRAEIESYGPIYENHFRRLSISAPLYQARIHRLVRRWQPDGILAWMPRAARLIPEYPGAVKATRLGDYPKNLKHFGACDVLICNTPGIAERVRDLGWTKAVEVITNFPREVVPNSIDRARFDTPEGAFVVAGSGRFVPRKGFDLLVRAVAALPDAWLWLIGEGQERAALEALVAEMGLAERTRFLGWLDEPIHAVAAADAFVMASRHEPLGNVILEAWRAGVPVVTSRAEGPSWFASDGADCRMVEIDAVAPITAALAEMQARPELRARLAAGGRDTLESRFTRARIVARYLDVLGGAG